MRNRIRQLLLLLALLQSVTAVTHGQAARVSLLWLQDRLVITWSAETPVCLYLIGGGLPDTRIATPTCAPGGQVSLAYIGIDHAYTPIGRDALELRTIGGQALARVELIPPGRIYLPAIVRPPPAPPGPPRFLTYMPAITKAPEAAGAAWSLLDGLADPSRGQPAGASSSSANEAR